MQQPAKALRGVNAGLQLRWIKQWVKQVPTGMSTLDVMLNYIKPATKEKFCRYVTLVAEQEPGSVGKADAFVSHTWRAPFRDLVAALTHIFTDDQFVWIDIFAVLQWDEKDGLPANLVAEKTADLDFGSVVEACDYFVLVGMHIDKVTVGVSGTKVSPEAKQLCAFFRVWCLVEMAAALKAEKPVVLLVGRAARGDEIRFEPNTKMLGRLYSVMDISQAEASFPEDKKRILGDIQRGIGLAAVNTLARGAVTGAMYCMTQQEVLQAALGNGLPLAALKGRDRLSQALIAAAAGGLLVPLKSLLDRRREVNVGATCPHLALKDGMTPLHLAAAGGHAAAVQALLRARAKVEARDCMKVADATRTRHEQARFGNQVESRRTPLHWAAQGGYAEVVKVLLRARAKVEARDGNRHTPLHYSIIRPIGNDLTTVELLLRARANVRARTADEKTPLMIAASSGWKNESELGQLLIRYNCN